MRMENNCNNEGLFISQQWFTPKVLDRSDGYYKLFTKLFAHKESKKRANT